MRHLFHSLSSAIQAILDDKANVGLTSLMLIVGCVLYYLIGHWLFGTVMQFGRSMAATATPDSWHWFVAYLNRMAITILYIFLINMLVLLVVNMLCMPSLQWIAERSEKQFAGESRPPFGAMLGEFVSRWGHVLHQEGLRHLLAIVALIVIWGIGLIPYLVPVAFLLCGVVVSLMGLSYARPLLTLKELVMFWMRYVHWYTIMGLGLACLLAIPLLNLIALPYAIATLAIFARTLETVEAR